MSKIATVQGPGVLPNRGDKSIYKRDKKNWAVGSRVKGGHLNVGEWSVTVVLISYDTCITRSSSVQPTLNYCKPFLYGKRGL